MTGTESRLMSLSEGGGEPSTQPFHPFLAAVRFLRSFGIGGGGGDPSRWSTSENPSSGVCGRLEEFHDALEVVDGSGVDGGESSGGGVGDTERVASVGPPRVRQKDDVLLLTTGERVDATTVTADGPAVG